MRQELIEYPLVDDSGGLNDILEHIEDARLLALDTEFLRERTYYPELCVLQIATDKIIVAIDCLAPVDLDPLFKSLLAPEKIWLLHSARQDLEVLFYRADALPEQLIDTQIAAALIGLPMQIGLQGLLEETLQVSIGKQHTRSDWSHRPLPEALQRYALDDVRYLHPACRQLKEQLESLGRATWFDEECARQLGIPVEPEVQTIFERTRGTGSLKGQHRAAALALVAWREEKARARNRPRRWILADDKLSRIAAALPQSLADLSRVPDLPARFVARSGDSLLDAIDNAEPVDDIPEPAPPDRAVVKLLQSEIRSLAETIGIQPELLATRRDIATVAAGRLPETLSSGWRGLILGEILEKVSSGRAF